MILMKLLRKHRMLEQVNYDGLLVHWCVCINIRVHIIIGVHVCPIILLNFTISVYNC